VSEAAHDGVASGTPARARRLPVVFYTVAFVLMLGALGSMLLAVRSFLQELWPLWLSAGLSVAAILFAIAGMLSTRRRQRS
jgi:hypothetical protein